VTDTPAVSIAHRFDVACRAASAAACLLLEIRTVSIASRSRSCSSSANNGSRALY
jgi:hypothetical protein